MFVHILVCDFVAFSSSPLQSMDQLDLSANDTHDRLEVLFDKLHWTAFPGVHALLLKGLTLESTTESTHKLLSRITLHSTSPVFDQTRFTGTYKSIYSYMLALYIAG